MILAEIIDKWQVNGGTKPYLLDFIQDLADGGASPEYNITDITGQQSPPQTPNSVVIRGTFDADTFAAIEADTVNFYVIWSENV